MSEMDGEANDKVKGIEDKAGRTVDGDVEGAVKTDRITKIEGGSYTD